MGVKKSIGNFKMLKPLGHFYFWEVLKNKVYGQKPRGVGDIKNYVRDAFKKSIPRETCAKMFVEA